MESCSNNGDCDFNSGKCNCDNGFALTDCSFDYADCEYKSWINDDYCDDKSNTEACGFDGGDCCDPDSDKYSYCTECECINPDFDFD